MNQQNSGQSSKTLVVIVGTIIATAIILGGGIYWWTTKGSGKQAEAPVSDSQCAIPKASSSPEQTKTNNACEVNLPVVVYKPAGLLTETDKKNLQERLVNPFFDYYNESEISYITMTVDVPTKVGDPFTVEAIHKNGGYQGFLFGKRGGNIEWWKPECMGDCNFSEKFKAKYPAIVNNH